jgi:hypothetical protein
MESYSLSILNVPMPCLRDKIAEAVMFDVTFASNFKVGTRGSVAAGHVIMAVGM